jgi:type I restriction enzyme M protein
VDAVAPEPGQAICDPACGTGGFLLAAHDYLAKHHALDRAQKKKLKSGTFFGIELVDSVTRLCAMNLLLHGIGGEDADSPIRVEDALKSDPGDRFDVVMTNPPFGRKSSVQFVNAEGEAERESLVVLRDDFWASTSNKQLNFVQHVKTLLNIGGRAAVVVPDNVLFEGGAGETIRRKLLQECDVHTLLRLPTGIFYAQGVKANVLFFDRKPAAEAPWTKELWVYDYRTNVHHTLRQNPLTKADLDGFVQAFRPGARRKRAESDRFHRFTYDEVIGRDKVSLDISWLRDESLEDTNNLPPPDVLAQEIADDLEAALAEFTQIAESLRSARGSAIRPPSSGAEASRSSVNDPRGSGSSS